MIIHNNLILCWVLLFLPVFQVNGKCISTRSTKNTKSYSFKGIPYGSINDLYDTSYEYESNESQEKEEVFITTTPQFLSLPLQLVSLAVFPLSLHPLNSGCECWALSKAPMLSGSY